MQNNSKENTPQCFSTGKRCDDSSENAVSFLKERFLAEGSVHEHTTHQGPLSHQRVHSFKALAILLTARRSHRLFLLNVHICEICLFLYCQLSRELAPPLVDEALLFDLLDVRKEKRLMRRREKLPDFLWLLAAEGTKLLPMLERSSWDWLKQDSFSRCFLRNSSLVPLCRNPTLWSLRLRVSRAPVEPVSDSTSSTEGRSEASEGVVSSGSA